MTLVTSRGRLLVALAVSVLLLLLSARSGADSNRFKQQQQQKVKPKPAPQPVYNTDLIPTMEEMLKSIGLEHRTKLLYKMGFVDMRLMLRLKKMDYHMMRLEWADATDQEVALLKVCL